MVKVFSRFTFSLFCPAGVFPGNGCRCWSWDAGMSRGGKLGQRIPVFNWGWGQRGIREHIRFSATELGMILGTLDLRSSRRGVGGPSASLLPW